MSSTPQRRTVPRLHPERVRRRVHQLLLVLYAAFMLAAVAMVTGPVMNDLQFNTDGQRALATVTGTSALGVSVEYQDAEGIFHSPPTGLLYPTGLAEGQQVWVTYSASNPDLVKVEGRMWTLSIIPALSVAICATAVMGLLWWATMKSVRLTGS